MNAPYFAALSTGLYLTWAIVLGIFFGFFLERAGFGSALKLTSQFYFKDFGVLKVMFTAIVVAMLGLGFLSVAGWIDMSQVFVPATYLWPQLVGGLLLGSGFIIGGYCPGTSVAAAATGKIDAMFFIGGIFAGIFVFGEALPSIEGFTESGHLGELTLPALFDLNAGVVSLLVVLMAVSAFWVAEKSEGAWSVFAKTYGRRQESDSK